MRIFLCALPTATKRVQRIAGELVDAGHEIFSTWLYKDDYGLSDEEQRAQEAMLNMRDLVKSDCVLALTGASTRSASPMDEIFGAGVAFNKRVVLVGKPTNPFHYLPMVERYASMQEFIEQLRSE